MHRPHCPATSKRSPCLPHTGRGLHSRFGACLLAGLTLLSGCVSVTALRSDAEAVFREHNRVAAEVMLALPDLDPDAGATRRLVAADRTMLEACEPLNELAIAHRDGRTPTWRERLALPDAIDGCREATAATAALLETQP